MRHADLATHASLASLFIKPHFTSAAICGASVAEGPTPTRHSSDCRSTRQHAVPIGSVAWAWRSARSLLIRSSRSITAPLDLLRACNGERVIPRSLRTCPEPCKAVQCWVSPSLQGYVGEDTGLLARNSWSYENNFLAL